MKAINLIVPVLKLLAKKQVQSVSTTCATILNLESTDDGPRIHKLLVQLP